MIAHTIPWGNKTTAAECRRHIRRGTSAMETVLLLAAVGLPMMVLIFFGIRILAAHYGMVSTLNALPIG